MGVGATLFLNSCVSDDLGLDRDSDNAGYGTLTLGLTSNTKFTPTRALSETGYTNISAYTVKLVNAKNDQVVLEGRYSELNNQFPAVLEIGSYRLEASYGVEHPCSRDEFFMIGNTVVTIKANEKKEVNVACAPTCGKLSVAFDAGMATYFDDYSVTYSGTKAMGATGSCVWGKTDTDPWYVALEEGGETLHYTINLVAKDDYLHNDADGTQSKEATVEGSFTLERNRAHKLTIKPNYTPSIEGGLSITITIDEGTNDHEVNWEVPVTWL